MSRWGPDPRVTALQKQTSERMDASRPIGWEIGGYAFVSSKYWRNRQIKVENFSQFTCNQHTVATRIQCVACCWPLGT